MIQKTKINSMCVLLLMLSANTSPIIAAQPGDLDITFGDNGIVKRQQLWHDQPSSFEAPYLSTGLVTRAAPYNDIIAATNIIIQPPLDDAILFSYKKIDGSLNKDSFNPPYGYKLLDPQYNNITYKAISTISNPQIGIETDTLIMVGKQFLPSTNNISPILIQANALTGNIISTSNLSSISQQGIFNTIAVDRVNQYIFAGGSTLPNKSFRLTRFNASNFRENVIDVTTHFGESSHINNIALQSDNKVIVAGQTTNAAIPQFTLARYSQNITFDNTFGKVVVFTDESEAKAVTIQTIDGDEKIVAAGWIKIDNKQKLALVRYNLDGKPDDYFGNQGKVIENFGGDHVSAHAIAIDKNNRIIVVGEFSPTATLNPIFIIASYNTDGTLDTTFGQNGNGWVTTRPTQYGAILNAVAIDDNNTIVCSGFSINQQGIYEITIARYFGAPLIPGTPDRRFGNNGLVTTPISPASLSDSLPTNNSSSSNKLSVKNIQDNSFINSIVIRDNPYNDIVVVGTTETTPLSQTIASYNGNDGTLNVGSFGEFPSFQGYTNYRTSTANNAHAIAIQNNTIPDLNIVTAGSIFNATLQKDILAFFTFTPSGMSTDTTITEVPGLPGEFKAIAQPLSPPNSFLYAGFLNQTALSQNFILAKFNYLGLIDPVFGHPTLGQPTITNFTDTSQDFSQINAMAVYQTNGKIVVAGIALIEGKKRWVLARYLSNGQLDTTFAGDPDARFHGTGKIVTDFSKITLVPSHDDVAYGVALQEVDGEMKIVVVGATARRKGEYFVALARYNDDGTLDPTFGYPGTGIRINCFGSNSDEARAVIIDQNNKIVIAGIVATKPSSSAHQINKFLVARYYQDGNVDKTFEGRGRIFTPFFGKGAGAHALALQYINGAPKIVVGGFAIDNDGRSQFALARYNA